MPKLRTWWKQPKEKDLILRGDWAENGVTDEASFRASIDLQDFDITDFEISGDLVKMNFANSFGFWVENCLFLKEVVRLNTENFPPGEYGFSLSYTGVSFIDLSIGMDVFYSISIADCPFDLYSWQRSEVFANAMASGGENNYYEAVWTIDPIEGTNFEAILIAKGKFNAQS